MNPSSELYQEIILQHNQHPHHFHLLEDATGCGSGNNPLCGDRVMIFVKTTNQTIEKISFQGNCCAICKASASMMCKRCLGKPVLEGQTIAHDLLSEMTASQENPDFWKTQGEIQALKGVQQFPARIKCATLPWHALQDALTLKS